MKAMRWIVKLFGEHVSMPLHLEVYVSSFRIRIRHVHPPTRTDSAAEPRQFAADADAGTSKRTG